MAELPDFVPPMLAKRGPAFDSADHVFEVKWDGIRAVTFVDRDGLRGYTRNRVPLIARYPELEPLRGLAPGIVLDGELVALQEDRPDFELVLRREQARNPERVKRLALLVPVTYVVFDVLYVGFESVCGEPLTERRARLEELGRSPGLRGSRVVVSECVAEHGRAMFESACERGLEGVVAKRRDSAYLPGQRTDAWTKIKRSQVVYCVVVGFVPADDDPADFRSLIVASDRDDGELRVVGRVASGIDGRTRVTLNALLRESVRDTPIVPSDEPGVWVEPRVICEVGFLEWTRGGMLRAPVFRRLHSDA